MRLLGKRRGPVWWVCASVIALLLAFVVGTVIVNTYAVESTKGEVHTIAQIEESGTKADAILVLGASVYADGEPSDILADRLEVACDLYFAGCAGKIIVSGDNRESHYDESDAMRDYCVMLGVPEEDIVVDPKGLDTYASVYRAKYEYGIDSIMVVTQAYHLYRALMIANMLGFSEVDGVAADKGSYNDQWRYSIREVLARDKDFVQAALRLAPTES